ncbi:MAG TPA: OmpA family protein [Planctomycetota bacterium]|nr:OmpA family protein [Planctomycetota bacterium]
MTRRTKWNRWAALMIAATLGAALSACGAPSTSGEPAQPALSVAKPDVPPPPPPRRPRKRTTEFELDGQRLILPGPIVFETNSDRLSPVSDDFLEVVHDYLDAKPEITLLRIEGHMDNDGNPADNRRLSERRALSVARWFIAAGIKCDRLIPVGFGSSKPTVPNDTPDHKAMNRRIWFVNASLRGGPIGGAPVDGGGKVAGDPCKD